MSGTVGVVSDVWARSVYFTTSIMHLMTPVNTESDWQIGSDRIVGRNRLVERALDRGSEWLLFLDDDHQFQPDLLLRLLERDKDIVASLYLQRNYPYTPIAYTDRNPENDNYVALQLNDYGPDDLVPVLAAGTGGMLIKSEVFRALTLTAPNGENYWFEHGRISEDLLFCERAREAGFDVYCDLSARLVHIMVSQVIPAYDEKVGGWVVGIGVGDNSFYLPITHEDSDRDNS